jgi:hypothetical protein
VGNQREIDGGLVIDVLRLLFINGSGLGAIAGKAQGLRAAPRGRGGDPFTTGLSASGTFSTCSGSTAGSLW